jgi:death-on-curing protein
MGEGATALFAMKVGFSTPLTALDRPCMAFVSQDPLYPEPYDKAAALMEILIRNHPFVDGNKRTAYVAGITLLRYLTGERVDVPSEEALAVCQAVERKDWGTGELSAWFRDIVY